MDVQNGERQELKMEHVAHKVVRSYIEPLNDKLDKVLEVVGGLSVHCGSMQTEMVNIKSAVQENQDARTGQLVWFQRAILGALVIAIIGGGVAVGFKIAQAVWGVAQGG